MNPCPNHPQEPGKALPFVPLYGPMKGRSGVWQCNAFMGHNPDGTAVQGADKTGRCKFMWVPNQVPAASPGSHPAPAPSLSVDPRLTAMIAAGHMAALIYQGNMGPAAEIIAMTKRFYFELMEAAALGTVEP